MMRNTPKVAVRNFRVIASMDGHEGGPAVGDLGGTTIVLRSLRI